MTQDIFSFLSAAAGTICLVTWPLFSSRRSMLLVQLGIPSGYSVHYALVGAETGGLLNMLGAMLIVVSILFGTNPRLKWIGYAMIPAILIACIVTWTGLPSLLSTIGMILICIGRVQQSAEIMRWLVLAGTPFWLVHDSLVASPLIFADLLSIVVGTVALVRARMPRRIVPAYGPLIPRIRRLTQSGEAKRPTISI